MPKKSENKRVAIFSVIAAAIVLIMGLTVFSAISFMERVAETSLAPNINRPSLTTRFKFEKLKEIGIIKE